MKLSSHLSYINIAIIFLLTSCCFSLGKSATSAQATEAHEGDSNLLFNIPNPPEASHLAEEKCAREILNKLQEIAQKVEEAQVKEVKIDIAMFSLDHEPLIATLREIYERALQTNKDVRITILVDRHQMDTSENMRLRLRTLADHPLHRPAGQQFPIITIKIMGIPFVQGQAYYSNRTMHLKMALITVTYTDNTRDYYFTTGSFNWTTAGTRTNYENCLFVSTDNRTAKSDKEITKNDIINTYLQTTFIQPAIGAFRSIVCKQPACEVIETS